MQNVFFLSEEKNPSLYLRTLLSALVLDKINDKKCCFVRLYLQTLILYYQFLNLNVKFLLYNKIAQKNRSSKGLRFFEN